MVSIITVNFRQAAVTCALLDSIRRENQYTDIEVIVVDNGSQRDETALFERHYPGVIVLQSTDNLGFAGGNNLGIRAARGDYFFLVNNDTEWTAGLLEQLLARLESQPSIGIVSPKIRYFDDPQRIQYAGFSRIQPLTGRNRAIGKNELDRGQHGLAMPTAYAHGAAMLIRRSAVEKVGLMPEQYFLYYEEMDWCAHIRRAGFQIWYEPAALIYHKESAAVGRMSPLKVFYQTRNRILFMKNNQHTAAFVIFMFFFIIITISVNSVRFLIGKQRTLLAAFLQGFKAGIQGAYFTDNQFIIHAHERHRIYGISGPGGG